MPVPRPHKLSTDTAFAEFCQPLVIYEEIDERFKAQPSFLRRNLSYSRPTRSSQAPGQGHRVHVALERLQQPGCARSGRPADLLVLAVLCEVLSGDLCGPSAPEFLPHAAAKVILPPQPPSAAGTSTGHAAGHNERVGFSMSLPLGLLEAVPADRLTLLLLVRHAAPAPPAAPAAQSPASSSGEQRVQAAGQAVAEQVAVAPMLPCGKLFGAMPCGRCVWWGATPLTAEAAQPKPTQQQQQLEPVALLPARVKLSLSGAGAGDAAGGLPEQQRRPPQTPQHVAGTEHGIHMEQHMVGQTAQAQQQQSARPAQEWLRLDAAPSHQGEKPCAIAAAAVVMPQHTVGRVRGSLQAPTSERPSTSAKRVSIPQANSCPPLDIRYMPSTASSSSSSSKYVSETRLRGSCPFCSCYATTPSGLLVHMGASHDLFECTWLPYSTTGDSHTAGPSDMQRQQGTGEAPQAPQPQRSAADVSDAEGAVLEAARSRSLPAAGASAAGTVRGGVRGAVVVRVRPAQLEDSHRHTPGPEDVTAHDRAFLFCKCCCARPVDTLVAKPEQAAAASSGAQQAKTGATCTNGTHSTDMTAAVAKRGGKSAFGEGVVKTEQKKSRSGRRPPAGHNSKGTQRMGKSSAKARHRPPVSANQPRSYFHHKAILPFGTAELAEEADSAAEEDEEAWKAAQQRDLMHKDPQISPSEQLFMLMWNEHARRHPPLSDAAMPACVLAFGEAHGEALSEDPHLRRCFVVHLMTAWEYGMLDGNSITAALRASHKVD